MTPTEVTSDAPATSRWYGQGRAADVTRRLESLSALNPPPPPVGVVTAHRAEVTATFVGPLKTPLPHPWRPAESATEARIPWESVDPGAEPDPDHPVYLTVLGTTNDAGLIGLNLAAFGRIRLNGDAAIAVTIVSRWILELLATHPNITIGVTKDAWSGPLTSRVQPVAVSHVPPVDVLVCGPDLTYSDRAQIVSRSTSPIMIDLGKDAAVDTKWTITCSPDGTAEISNGTTSPMTATLILPGAPAIDRCHDLMTTSPGYEAAPPDPIDHVDRDVMGLDDPFEPAPAAPVDGPDPIESFAPSAAADVEPADSTDYRPTSPAGADAPEDEAGIDFFAPTTPPATGQHEWTAPPAAASQPSPDAANLPPQKSSSAPLEAVPAETPASVTPGAGEEQPAPETENTPPPPKHWPPTETASTASESRSPAADGALAGEAPQVVPIWNRILGQVSLNPPHSTQAPGAREKRLNELTVYLQHNPWAATDEIIRCIYGGAASDKTVTQQLSLLRARLGVARVAGPKALPPMSDGGYHLDNAVRSDWMEFERLVEIFVEATPTSHLAAAMDLVTGPPLGGIPPKEWAWTTDLRAELSDRVGGVAAALARRLLEAKQFSAAVEIARKGLWYDAVRQDLWRTGLQAALDGHDSDTFKTLRGQYFNAVAAPDRDPAVLELAKQAG